MPSAPQLQPPRAGWGCGAQEGGCAFVPTVPLLHAGVVAAPSLCQDSIGPLSPQTEVGAQTPGAPPGPVAPGLSTCLAFGDPGHPHPKQPLSPRGDPQLLPGCWADPRVGGQAGLPWGCSPPLGSPCGERGCAVGAREGAGGSWGWGAMELGARGWELWGWGGMGLGCLGPRAVGLGAVGARCYGDGGHIWGWGLQGQGPVGLGAPGPRAMGLGAMGLGAVGPGCYRAGDCGAGGCRDKDLWVWGLWSQGAIGVGRYGAGGSGAGGYADKGLRGWRSRGQRAVGHG